jgi:four helix bundle protein
MGQGTSIGLQKGYKALLVWQEAHALVLLIYSCTEKFPKSELFGLTSQLRRAGVSIPANIVEGYARFSRKEFSQFISISLGSLAEVEYYLDLSRDLAYLTKDEYAKLVAQRIIVGKLLYGFSRSIKARI